MMASGGKQKLVAGLLGIFLGCFGVHHFYLGSTTAGLICLGLFFLCGISWIIGLIEGILLLVMKDEEFEARYNQRTPGPMEFVFQKPQ